VGSQRTQTAPKRRFSPVVLAGTFGVAATFLGIGVCYLAVTVYGLFNPGFRELDRLSVKKEAAPQPVGD